MSEVLDLIDQAQQQCEHNLAAQLANAARPVPRLPYTGDCYNPICANTPPAPQPFCCGACEKAFVAHTKN